MARALALQVGGYGKVINHVVIGLKTVKGTKQLKLDPTIYDALQKEKARCGQGGQSDGCAREAAPAQGSNTLSSARKPAGPGRRRDLHRGQQRLREARRPLRRVRNGV